MILYRLALDYDDCPLEFVLFEAVRLKDGVHLDIYRSSENCYHIRASESLSWEHAIEIIETSNCSQAYKDFCKRVQRIPIRTSRKVWYNPDGIKLIKGSPVKILSL